MGKNKKPDKISIIVGLVVIFLLFLMLIPKKHIIKKEQFGDKWAFTVNELELKCDMDAVYAIHDEYIYPLNGLATAKFKNNEKVRNVSEIQLDDNKANQVLEKISNGKPYTKVKKSIYFAVEEGSKFCK